MADEASAALAETLETLETLETVDATSAPPVDGVAFAGGAAPPSKKRRTITLEQKLNIINRFDGGESASRIGRLFGLPRTTVTTIIRDKVRIREHVLGSAPMQSTIITKRRSGLIAEMEKLLIAWLKEQYQDDTPISLSLIQEKARCIYGEVKKNSGKDPSEIEPFIASRGWFNKFKLRSKMENLRTSQAIKSSCDFTPTPDEFWKSYSIYKSLTRIYESWVDITSLNTNSVWLKLSSDFILDFQSLEKTIASIKGKILTMSRELGPSEIEQDVLEELDFQPSEESSRALKPDIKMDTSEPFDELPQGDLTDEVLKEGFALIEKAMQLFESKDPNKDRSASVTWALSSAYSCYRDLYDKNQPNWDEQGDTREEQT